MHKDEYISAVISQIQNKRARAEVEREISAHIDDRISYYTDAGWDEVTASEKALAHMGDPCHVGAQMAKLHPSVGTFLWIVFAYLMLHSFIILAYSTFVETENASIGGFFFVEPVFFLTVLFFSNIGRQRRNTVLTSITFFTHIVLTAIKTICMFVPAAFGIKGSFRSPTVIYFLCLLKGEVNIFNYVFHSGIRPYFWVVAISMVFYLAVLVVLLMNFLYSIKKNTVKRSSSVTSIMERASALLSVPCILLVVVICAQFVWGMANRESEREREREIAENSQSPQEIYIYESDEPTDISDLSEYNIVEWNNAEGAFDYLLYINSRIIKSSYQTDSFYEHWYETPPEYIINDKDVHTFISNDYKGVFEYSVCHDEISFKPTKQYVYVLPVCDYIPEDEEDEDGEWKPKHEYNQNNWLNTDEKHTFNYEQYDDNILILTVEARD